MPQPSQIRVLDATSSRAWRNWPSGRPRPDNPENDRTNSTASASNAKTSAGSGAILEDPTALFAGLGIQVEIREARPPELKRITELINRTNQFNLAGTRTTLKEIREWHGGPGRHIVVVEASDKFGPMGVVCIACA